MTEDQEPREVSEALELAAFREAGFSAEQAQRGVQMLASGHYFGFADAATSLATFEHTPMVSASGIREAGERLEVTQKAVQESSPKSAEESALQEIDWAVSQAFGRPVQG
ncbi:MAG: hypothetical protein VX494_14730 [Actinomycetota bacterium]|nr:hypothetical protein [Actinomycetota bacterium]